MFKKLFAALITVGMLGFAGAASAQEAADAFVKRISQEVLETAKTDKDIQSGNQQKILEVVQAKILPNVDFQRMTSLAAGRHWRTATPEQQQKLSAEFRTLLVYTYSGALSQIKNETVEFKPLRAAADDTEVEVRSQVNVARGEPVLLNYRVAKSPTGWKIYDINVMGAWLVETYKSSFNSEISKGGIDGLIKTLADKNKALASRPAAKAK